MRSTLTLDPDVAARIKRELAGGKKSLKRVVNERLRLGFGMAGERPGAPFAVEPHESAYRPGVDAVKLNQLVDELDAETFRGRSGPVR